MAERCGEISRKTKETSIHVAIKLDGAGAVEAATGVGFMDHMLAHVARHGLMDIQASAQGDLEVDAHHTVEDLGICLGQALVQAVGDAKGLTRFGHAVVPMDESLAEAALDLSGRPYLNFEASFAHSRVGDLDVELVEEFFRALAMNGRFTLHLLLRRGGNVHHGIEAMFKAFGRALAEAVRQDPRVAGVPSTKGVIET